MFFRVWFDWARPDDDIWGVGGSPSRSSAGRSRRSRICTAAAATPAAILDTEVELRETLVRTSSSADRSGTRAHKKRPHRRLLHTQMPCVCVCVCVCDDRCIDLYMHRGWRFICSMAHNMDPDAPSPFYLQGAKPVWLSRWCDTQRAALVSWMNSAKCAARTGNPTPSLTVGTISISPLPVLTNTLFLNKGWLHT